MTDSILWFATRGAGIVSLLLFTGVVTLGILTAGRWQTRSWPRFITARLHRDIALLSVVFLAVHIVTAVVDPFTALGPLAVLVPFAVDYERFWLGLGTVALDLGLAIVLTSLFRSRVGVRTWRAVHWLSYDAWPIALLHGHRHPRPVDAGHRHRLRGRGHRCDRLAGPRPGAFSAPPGAGPSGHRDRADRRTRRGIHRGLRPARLRVPTTMSGIAGGRTRTAGR
jgi:sulfoxide reductase heme-binding subunit YedZ